jgi:hypothetical protein
VACDKTPDAVVSATRRYRSRDSDDSRATACAQRRAAPRTR